MLRRECRPFWKRENRIGKKSSRILYLTLKALGIQKYSDPALDGVWSIGGSNLKITVTKVSGFSVPVFATRASARKTVFPAAASPQQVVVF
jgi:hypothetical protein